MLVNELTPLTLPYFEEWDRKRERDLYSKSRRRLNGGPERLVIKEIEAEEEAKRQEILKIAQQSYLRDRNEMRSRRRTGGRINYVSQSK